MIKTNNFMLKTRKTEGIYKIGNDYVFSGKGAAYGEAAGEVEENYRNWVKHNEYIGYTENEIIERLNELSEIDSAYEDEYYMLCLRDGYGIIGTPIGTKNKDESIVDIYLLLLYISQKCNDTAQKKIRAYLKDKVQKIY